MKNIMKKITILTAALALAVLFGFAVSDTASAAESRAQAAAADTYMSAATINYSTSTKGDATTISTSGGSNYYVYSVEVKTSGKLYMDALAYNSNSSSCYVDLGTYDGSVFNHGSSTYLSAGSEKDGIGGYDVKKGTYWVGIQSSSSASAYVRAYVIPYSTRKLPAGKMMIASGYKNSYQDSAAKFKIRPTKSGYITVTLKQYGYDSSSGYVTLLNSKKRAVSDKLWYYSSSTTSYVVFGVKKGVTYYLRVNSCQGSSSYQYAYGIKFKQKAALLKKNIKKSKSLLLKRKAKYKSMTRQATGKAMNQWYKIRVPRKQKTQVRVDASKVKSGSAKITLYYGSKKIDSATIYLGKINTFNITYSTTYGQAMKGTYYIKVTTSKKCSGMYKIRYLR